MLYRLYDYLQISNEGRVGVYGVPKIGGLVPVPWDGAWAWLTHKTRPYRLACRYWLLLVKRYHQPEKNWVLASSLPRSLESIVSVPVLSVSYDFLTVIHSNHGSNFSDIKGGLFRKKTANNAFPYNFHTNAVPVTLFSCNRFLVFLFVSCLTHFSRNVVHLRSRKWANTVRWCVTLS